MPEVLVFRPDGSFYYKNVTDTSELNRINSHYNSHYSSTGFHYDRYVFVFYGTIINKSFQNDNFNFIGDEAWNLIGCIDDDCKAVGEFAISKHLNGDLVDIEYKDFHSARNEYIKLMHSNNVSFCNII